MQLAKFRDQKCHLQKMESYLFYPAWRRTQFYLYLWSFLCSALDYSANAREYRLRDCYFVILKKWEKGNYQDWCKRS